MSAASTPRDPAGPAEATVAAARRPSARARLGVVILNYRTPQLVIDCLRSLHGEVDPERDRVVVVDNASGDGSAKRIRAAIAREGWAHARVVESSDNGGFSAGNNIGIRAVDAAAYLLLNSDTVVRPGAIQRLREALEGDPAAGLVGPRLEDPDGSVQVSCFRSPTVWSELIYAARTSAVSRALARYVVPVFPEEAPTDPEWTSFAAVLIRREVFEQVGLLDEGYFMYFEDVDYCRRARRAGWKIRHQAEARVVHLHGASSHVEDMTRARERRPRYYYASRSRYFRKAFGEVGLLAANSMWTIGRGVSALREVFGKKPPHTVAFELVDNWRG